MRGHLFAGCLAAAAIAAAFAPTTGCGGGSANTGGTGGGTTSTTNSTTSSTTSGMAVGCDDPTLDTSACAATLKASGADDTKAVQTALISVQSSTTLCFCPGTYHFTQQLSLTVPSVTVKGVGANIDDTLLDFSGVTMGGNDTMLVTADNFTIENLAVKNTPGNGVVVRQADSPTFRKLHVSWDDPDNSKHGAYAIYPAECKNVLVEDNEVSGAADAAIYVGQGTGAILRRNKAHDSVLGIELENTTNGEAYDNESWNNSGGLAVFLLGNLNKKTANNNLLHDNNVHDNNHDNFGDPTTVVSKVPVGTGIIVVGADDTEIRNNTVQNNESSGVMVVSYALMQALIPGAMADPSTDPYPERTFIHDNTFMGNGTNPQGPVAAIGNPPLENVLWDGWVASGMASDNNAKFCLGSKSPYPSFRMFDGKPLACLLGGGMNCGMPMASTDTTPYQCDLPAIAGNPP